MKYQDIKNVSLDNLNKLLNTLLIILVPQISTNLIDGIKLPLLEPFFSMEKSEMTLLDQYIRFDFNPVPSKKHISELINQILQSMVKSYSEVKNLRRLYEKEKAKIPEWLWS